MLPVKSRPLKAAAPQLSQSPELVTWSSRRATLWPHRHVTSLASRRLQRQSAPTRAYNEYVYAGPIPTTRGNNSQFFQKEGDCRYLGRGRREAKEKTSGEFTGRSGRLTTNSGRGSRETASAPVKSPLTHFLLLRRADATTQQLAACREKSVLRSSRYSLDEARGIPKSRRSVS